MPSSDNPHSLQAQVFAALSAKAVDQDPERSILLGMQALDATLRHGEPTELPAQLALRQAIWHSRLRLVLRVGDKPAPTCADWNRDGTAVVTGSDGGPVILWDAKTGEPLWSNPYTNAWTIAFSPDGLTIAVGGLFPNVVILNAATGTLLKTIVVSQAFSVRFSPDGRRVAIQNLVSSGIWDVETGSLWKSLGGGSGCNLAWSPDGKRIATCANGVRLWDASTGAGVLSLGPDRNVVSVTWSPDSTLLAVALDGACEIWDTASGTPRSDVGAFGLGSGILAWCPDGKRLAKRSGEQVEIFDVAHGDLSMTLRGHRHGDANPFLTWSRDGTQLATGTGQTGPMSFSQNIAGQGAGKRGYLNTKIWDLRVDGGLDGMEWATLRFSEKVFSAAFSPDGARIAVACFDAIRIVDAEHGTEWFRVPTQANNQDIGVAWSPDGAWLVVNELGAAGGTNVLRIWFAANGEALLTLPVVDAVPVATLQNLSWSADGSRLAATYASHRAAVWDMRTRQLVSSPDAGMDSWLHALSPDGAVLAVVTGSGAVTIRDIESGRVLRTLSAPNAGPLVSMVWLADGKRLVTVTSATVTGWYVPGEALLYSFANPPGVVAAAFSPDHTRLALLAMGGGQTVHGAGPDGDIPVLSLWDLESGQRLPQPEFLEDYPATLQPLVYWRPDGQQLVTSWPKSTGLFDGSNGPYWAGIERFVRISDSGTGHELFAVNHVPADNVSWRPDGKRMACCYGQRVQIYTCDAHELMALARSRITRNFTFDECVQFFERKDPPPIP